MITENNGGGGDKNMYKKTDSDLMRGNKAVKNLTPLLHPGGKEKKKNKTQKRVLALVSPSISKSGSKVRPQRLQSFILLGQNTKIKLIRPIKLVSSWKYVPSKLAPIDFFFF